MQDRFLGSAKVQAGTESGYASTCSAGVSHVIRTRQQRAQTEGRARKRHDSGFRKRPSHLTHMKVAGMSAARPDLGTDLSLVLPLVLLVSHPSLPHGRGRVLGGRDIDDPTTGAHRARLVVNA